MIDEQGNEYEATYFKRAKGLVKNGRARFVNERTLCLMETAKKPTLSNFCGGGIAASSCFTATKTSETRVFSGCEVCSPNKILEDERMDNNKIKDAVEKAYAAEKVLEGVKMPQAEAKVGISLEWVCAKIDAIVRDTAHIKDALSALREMKDGGISTQAESMGIVVKAREETNRQTLKLLEKMYDDLRPARIDGGRVLEKLDISHAIECMESEDVGAFLRELVGVLKK